MNRDQRNQRFRQRAQLPSNQPVGAGFKPAPTNQTTTNPISRPTHPTTNTQSKPIIQITKITVQTTHQPNHHTPTNQHPKPVHPCKSQFRLDSPATSVVQTKTSAQSRPFTTGPGAQNHRRVDLGERAPFFFDAANDNQILKSACGRDNHRDAQSDLISRGNGEIDGSKQPAAVPATSLVSSDATQTKTRLRRSL